MTWNFIQVINTDTIDFSVLCLFVRSFLYSPIYTSESLLTLFTNCLLNMCHIPAEINSVVNSYENKQPHGSNLQNLHYKSLLMFRGLSRF